MDYIQKILEKQANIPVNQRKIMGKNLKLIDYTIVPNPFNELPGSTVYIAPLDAEEGILHRIKVQLEWPRSQSFI